jgi:hypothetical protein
MSDDLRRRYAEAIAAKFTYPTYRSDRDGENERVENPDPADRIDQTPYVMVTAGDGCRSFWTPSCAELAEVVAAVRDEELERLRRQVADYEEAICWGTTCLEHARLLTECRRQEERAEKAEHCAATAEATISRVRQLADVYELNSGTVDGVAARNFFELFAAELRDALNPPPALLAEEETGPHVEP